MIGGIYCSNTGLNAIQKKLEVISNNIANCNTDGFKQSEISIKTFKQEINGVIADKVKNNFSDGSLKETDNICNFAISGDAFFKINTTNGDVYTKNGSFSTNNEGFLVDTNGNKVAGINGNVKMVDGKPDQDFYLASFKNKEYLSPTEGGFLASDLSGESQAKNINVSQGYVETSNVDLAQNMIDMMSVERSFALNSKMITSQDEMLKQAAEEIGSLR